ncbi:winged helix DNA-binding protein [Sporosarcina sp. Marseille-Q4063]|uniref:MarR family winged helix-turn-helix transcriptional regulator n=1 Tax=Sporosarcina sp. Marseille-Q4063 TaxID=2810514 RepID=UPI001BAF27BB|nr:winged helix DNA-binding protein [Sporosarcina sp. Marseille-Q4063]QUW22614.1 winged helix DNA-binding protein [Sporosarcina sp. Marseille-Q4063]
MKPHKQLFYAYSALYRPYFNQLNAQLAPFNLTSSQWAILHFILLEGAHTISDVSIYHNVERPTITKMVQRLTELDYVEAQPGEDKRTRFIRLSENGQAVCEQVQERLSAYQSYLLEEIPEADQLLVADVLRKISARININEDGLHE